MDKRTAKKVKVGDWVKYMGRIGRVAGANRGKVVSRDDGPGADPRVKYPLFDCRFTDDPGAANWITYLLLKLA